MTVTHGLSQTPNIEDIQVTPNSSLGAAVQFWVSNVTATTFTINVNVAPEQTITFGWQAILLFR